MAIKPIKRIFVKVKNDVENNGGKTVKELQRTWEAESIGIQVDNS